MTPDHDGHTVNVGPVTVGVDPGRDRLWMLANWPKGNHLTIVLHDYCDEVDRLRAKNAELRRLVRLLHPDPAPDPHTADWLQREGLLDQLRRCIHDAGIGRA